MKLCVYCESAVCDEDGSCIVCGGETFKTGGRHYSMFSPVATMKNERIATTTKRSVPKDVKPSDKVSATVKSEPIHVEYANYCTACGGKAEAGSAYCVYCGHKLETIKK